MLNHVLFALPTSVADVMALPTVASGALRAATGSAQPAGVTVAVRFEKPAIPMA
jgi:hypothetical protein